MLIAYEDQGFLKIRYIPLDGAKVPLYPIDSFAKAEEIHARAKKERPDVRWSIKWLTKGKGPYGVHENYR